MAPNSLHLYMMEVRQSIVREALIGAAAGVIATAPMSAVMLGGQTLFPSNDDRLPPKEITMRLLRASLLKFRADDTESHVVTTLAHFAYGGAMGAIYSPLANSIPAHQPIATGMTWGMIVWIGSYFGLLPATGLRWSAAHDSKEKNITMILAHLVYGAALGVMTDRWTNSRSKSSPPLRGFAKGKKRSNRKHVSTRIPTA